LKHIKSEESLRPTSNFLELKSFESSRSKNKCLNICAAADHSAQLVWIVDTLGDLPVVVGNYGTTSWNYSATVRLLHFIANLIFPFRAQHTRIKGNLQADRRFVPSCQIHVVTRHYQRFSSSQYLLQMQAQAQQKYSNSLTQRMIPYSHTKVSSFKALESNATLTLKKKNTMHAFTHKFARIFQSTFVSAHSRSKRSFKACNRVECKCMSSHIVYATSFDLIIVVHSCSFNYVNYSSHRGLLGAVSRDRRYTRRITFWSISSPFCFSLQPLRTLSRWMIWYCFTELLNDTSTAPFHRQLDLSLQGSAHWNKR
ncbi:hypothetical protein H5410_045611, partial [Solanum commersonii]